MAIKFVMPHIGRLHSNIASLSLFLSSNPLSNSPYTSSIASLKLKIVVFGLKHVVYRLQSDNLSLASASRTFRLCSSLFWNPSLSRYPPVLLLTLGAPSLFFLLLSLPLSPPSPLAPFLSAVFEPKNDIYKLNADVFHRYNYHYNTRAPEKKTCTNKLIIMCLV